MVDFSLVVLVDANGFLLMQERDEHAPIDPEKWGFCGGSLEPGEDAETAAYRELAEETGVQLVEGLIPIDQYSFIHPQAGNSFRFALFAAATTLTDADIVCAEGRRIVFVHPAVAQCLDLSESARICLAPYLDSDHYRALVGVV